MHSCLLICVGVWDGEGRGMWVWESIHMAKISPKNSLTQCQLKIMCVCVSVIDNMCLLEIKWEKLI